MNMNKTIIIVSVITFGIMAVLFFGFTSQNVLVPLSGESFMEKYRETPGAILVDVRTPAEFASGHIDGAVNIDFEDPSFTTEITKLDKTKTYFLYCRSGNRSGQAALHMQKNSFQKIYDLQGGIVSNQRSISLVLGETTSEYVVDASDMVNGAELVANIPTSVLTQKETSGLIQMREEEKLAHDVYTTLGDRWGMKVFSNIASSEETHTSAIKTLLDRYTIPDPAKGKGVGEFQSQPMQELYDTLVTQGNTSLLDALIVGAMVEDLDIRDLDVLKKETTQADILLVYENLQKGSRNHLRGFSRNISANGGTYTPKYITSDAYAVILGAAQERGRK